MSKKLQYLIEFTDAYIKVCQGVMQPDGLVVLKADVVPVENMADPKIIQELTKRFNFNDIKDDNLIISIPRRQVILKQLSLPSQNDQELRRMISLQISAHVPFNREDIVFDYSILEKDTNGYAAVLVAVINKPVIQHYLEMLHKMNVYPQKIFIRSFGVAEYFYWTQKGNNTSALSVVIDVDTGGSEICFCQDGALLFSRHINVGYESLTETEIGRFVDQVMLTFGAYRKSYKNEDIAYVHIMASGDRGNQLMKYMSKLHPAITVIDKGPSIKLEKEVNMATIQEKGISLAAIYGFMINSDKKYPNLLPVDIQNTKKLKVERKILVRFILALALTVAVSAVSLGLKLREDRLYLEGLEDQLTDAKKGMSEIEKQSVLIRFFDEKIKSKILFADVMSELYRLTPADISYQSLEMTQQGLLIIQGFSQNGSTVSQLQGQLVNSGFFKEVTLQYATKRKIFTQDYTDFRIQCTLQFKVDGNDS
ncbi:MAG: pilus assembly protein PilM [Candidatus Omnitrophica bacterium]|nr:pilus assembly protein PilM [Candidatus Omnitrophota bacterium]